MTGRCNQPTERGVPCVLHADHSEPNIHHVSPAPGEFCHTHWSWLCQAGQGKCQEEAAVPAEPPSHLWACGCLVNDGDAHRVGCPDHPEGVRGSRL